ncbi:MAG: sensor histidine kinase [Planctomycetota bacterium]
MATTGATPSESFSLPLPAAPEAPAQARIGEGSFPEPALARNALWLCNLRWGAIAMLVTFGVMGLFTDRIVAFGLQFRSDWPLVMAGILIVANVAFIVHARVLIASGAPRGARLNIWSQVVLDLVAHTFAVHYVGSLETYALFVYLFHIVLSCMFFSRLQSFLVAALACALLALCFGLEAAGVVSSSSIFVDVGTGGPLDRATWPSALNVASAMVIWLVVWYGTSYLSGLVRKRGAELVETNRRLVEAQEEKTRHLLVTAHELKAPFAAIHANAQLLLKGHGGPLTDEAHESLLGIASGCRRMAHGIKQTLQLANLRSPSATATARAPADLALDDVVRASVAQVRPTSDERKVVIEEDLQPASIHFDEEQLKVLLANLLSNAVAYSHEGGTVDVASGRLPDGRPMVTVEDHGIGIPSDELPRIFDEYYRTDEAAQFNEESSGLGLAIVKHVAQTHKVNVRVESIPGKGTKFILHFPPGRGSTEAASRRKEKANGLPADR